MKIFTYIIVFFCFLLPSHIMQAQLHLGIKAGALQSTFKGEDVRGILTPIYGGTGAMSMEYQLSDLISGYTELSYFGKGTEFVDNTLGSSSGILTVEERMHYLVIPIGLKITSGRTEKFNHRKGYGRKASDLNTYIIIGISFGLLVNHSIDASAVDEYGTYLDPDTYYDPYIAKLDQALELGAGVVYKHFWLDLRLSNSLVSIFDPELNDPLLVRNYCISAQFGYTIPIKLKNKPF